MVYLGDNLLKGGIADQADAFRASNADATVLLSKVTEPQRFGVAQFDSKGKLENLVEKPKQPPSPYALVGVYFFDPKIFEAIRPLKPSWRGELEITEAIQNLLESGCTVDHMFVQGWWKDTGTPEDILEANRLVLDDKLGDSSIEGIVDEGAVVQGRVRIGKGTTISKGVTIRGPASVGSNATVAQGTYVGPYTSIGSGCSLLGCEVENTIIMDSCRITARSRIVDSLVGRETEITSEDDEMPRGHRFILGEGSRVIL